MYYTATNADAHIRSLYFQTQYFSFQFFKSQSLSVLPSLMYYSATNADANIVACSHDV